MFTYRKAIPLSSEDKVTWDTSMEDFIESCYKHEYVCPNCGEYYDGKHCDICGYNQLEQ